MTIQERVKTEIISAMKNRDAVRRDSLKYIMSLFQNKSKNIEKTVSDAEAIAIIKNTLKGIKDTQKLIDVTHETYKQNEIFIAICEEFLPKQATEEEIKKYIYSIDFSKYNNKNQIIGIVLKHFNGQADGNLVKELVMNT